MESDGAIVITHCADCARHAPTVRQLLRWYIPDAIIAFCIGAIVGSVLDACVYR